MKDNPYTGLLGIMRTEGETNNPTVYATGEVLSVEPLCVRSCGIKLDADDLMVNSFLKKGAERELILEGTICEVSKAEVKATAKKWALEAGDTVLMIPDSQRQRYYVICKLEGA